MRFADLARTLADRGDVTESARNIAKARRIYEGVEGLLLILTRISAEERTSIENKRAAIARIMDGLFRRP